MSLENHNFEFGEFLLDAREKVLLRDGKPLPITPKVFQLLFVLVKNHGHLVEKDELMKLVWTDTVVEEGNIAYTIGFLRKALGDDSQDSRFIETVPRRGYRFIGEVVERSNRTTSEIEPIDAVKIPVDETGGLPGHAISVGPVGRLISGRPTLSKPAFLIFGIVLLLSLAVGGWYAFKYKVSPGVVRSIAILPLKPIDPANRSDLYENGVADSLIQRLNSIRGFVVRPLSAVRGYTEIEQDALTAGREQKVDYVFASSYQLADGKIKITSQLINVATEKVEESYNFEKEASSVFTIQDAIANDVGKRLMSRFGLALNGPAPRRGTSNEDAYRFYLQGMSLVDKRGPVDVQKAVENLDQAVKLDPNYARAWAGKAIAHRAIAFGSSASASDEYQKSIAAIDRALSLDPNISDAYSALCENKFQYEYDFVGAERACRRALDIDPDSSTAHRTYSVFLNSRGRFNEAMYEINTAIDLEPASYVNQRSLGNGLYFARRYQEAATQYKRLIQLNENADATYQWLIRTLEMQGNESEAFDWFIKSLTLQKRDNETIQRFKNAYQSSGWRGVLLERVRIFGEEDANYFRLACWNARIGDKDKAFEYLEKAYQRHSVLMATLQVEPQLDSLHDDPRYAELVKRVESK